MSPRPIRYSFHARQRMALRGITEAMVRETVETPDRTGIGYQMRFLAWRTFAPGTIKVVYSERPQETFVITVMWV